jgi:prepilin peptidase CpaA
MLIFCLALALLACYHDLRAREIPDRIPLAMLAGAIAAAALGHIPWWFIPAGMLVGFMLSAPWFYLGGFGGGDVKLIIALGAWLGPWQLLIVLLWIALFGAVLSIAAGLRGQRDLAYAPAIALGLALHVAAPNLLFFLLPAA